MTQLRFLPLAVTLTLTAALVPFVLEAGSAWAWAGYALVAGLGVLGLHDITQTKHSILRNFPILGHARYLFEAVRPELRQYFFEDDLDGRPFHREQRSLVYQRAKGETDYDPFGSELDVREVGYEWIGHSIAPKTAPAEAPRARIGGPHCQHPYEASLLNVSAMSFGSLGPNAVLALGKGAQQASYALNTGEGGISRFHLETGADLIWQLGTGYFGARAADGTFDADAFRERARIRPCAPSSSSSARARNPVTGASCPGTR